MKAISKKLLVGLMVVAMFFTLIPAMKTEAASVKLNKTKLSLCVGETWQLKISGSKEKVTWSSSNKKVVAVTKTGTVKGVKVGSATITAKVSGKTYTSKVSVKKGSFGNLYSDVAGAKVELRSTGFDKGTSKQFTLSKEDQKVLTSYGDEFLLATKGDSFYFDSFRSMADLSSIESVYVSVAYYFRNSEGELWGDGGENIGYLYWTDGEEVVDVWKNGMEVPDGSVIKYDENFHWKNHVKNYGLENAIYSVEMVDKDGSWIKFAITYDSKLFSYAK